MASQIDLANVLIEIPYEVGLDPWLTAPCRHAVIKSTRATTSSHDRAQSSGNTRLQHMQAKRDRPACDGHTFVGCAASLLQGIKTQRQRAPCGNEENVESDSNASSPEKSTSHYDSHDGKIELPRKPESPSTNRPNGKRFFTRVVTTCG
jgi:hypothetical protein